MKIMLFENDLLSATYIEEMLKKNGHLVILAKDGGNMPEMLRDNPVDLVITDIFLDNVSGLQIVLDVKEHAPEVKVLAISGGGDKLNYDYLDYALEFGADAVLRKPLEESRLTTVLDTMSAPAPPGI